MRISAFDAVLSEPKAIALPYPIPVIKIIETANLFFGDSCNRKTPEIGRRRM